MSIVFLFLSAFIQAITMHSILDNYFFVNLLNNKGYILFFKAISAFPFLAFFAFNFQEYGWQLKKPLMLSLASFLLSLALHFMAFRCEIWLLLLGFLSVIFSCIYLKSFKLHYLYYGCSLLLFVYSRYCPMSLLFQYTLHLIVFLISLCFQNHNTEEVNIVDSFIAGGILVLAQFFEVSQLCLLMTFLSFKGLSLSKNIQRSFVFINIINIFILLFVVLNTHNQYSWIIHSQFNFISRIDIIKIYASAVIASPVSFATLFLMHKFPAKSIFIFVLAKLCILLFLV